VAETERVLFVHAHPDDEAITTGGTIAVLLDSGAAVAVLTCTRGEAGEVIPPELRHLTGTDALAAHRDRELADALAALGVGDAVYLGAEGARREGLPRRRYTDSGMRWGDDGRAAPVTQTDPDTLTVADPSAVAADIATAALAFDATAVVSYDAGGGYGHPDHIAAARAARRAADVLGLPFWAVLPEGADPGPDDVTVDIRPALERKRRALAAHRTQLVLHSDGYELPDGRRHPIPPTESFRLIPTAVPERAPVTVGSRVLRAAALLAAGLLVGVLGTVGHRGAEPWGLVAALVAVLGLVAGLRLLLGAQLPALVAAVGVLAAQGVLALPGPGGSVLVPDGLTARLWTYGSLAIVLLVLVWPSRTRPTRSASGGRTGAATRPR